MNERNYSIDILKFVCAILVVFLHTGWNLQQEFLPFTRCAVPCFFIISGYLLFDADGIKYERLIRSLSHVGKISLWATLFFFIWKETIKILGSHSIWIPSRESLINWLLFNENPFASHLWYLFAYLYVLIIILFVNYLGKWKILYWMIPFLLMIDLIFGKYSLLLWGWEPPYFVVRNFLFVGLPYFAIGTIIKRSYNDTVSIKKQYLYCGIVLFTLTTYIEKYWLIYMDKCAIREHYLSSTFLSIVLFLLSLSIKSRHRSWFSAMGEKDSLYIYIFHPIFIYMCSVIFKKIHMYEFYMWIAPIIVLISTILFIKCMRKIKII